jgi:hypothetical protein
MTRRHVLSLVSRVAASTAGQAFFPSWLSAQHEHTSAPPPETDRWSSYSPQFFSATDFHSLEQFVSILLPTDETPGAKEAHVAPFIDFILSQSGEYSPETQTQWRHTFDWLNQTSFPHQSTAEQTAFMQEISQRDHANFHHFQLIKELTVYAFYTSRVGLIDNLEYQGLAYLSAFPACTHPEHRTV